MAVRKINDLDFIYLMKVNLITDNIQQYRTPFEL